MKRKLSIKKIVVFYIYILFAILIIFGIVQIFSASKKTVDVEIVDTIDDYGYVLDDKATSYIKSLFEELSKVLKEETLDEKAYAEILCKIFITDFYTLDNKLNKNDIGGLRYVYTDFVNDFSSLAQNSIYKTVKNNMYGDRVQELPVVSEVVINGVENKQFKYNDKTFDNAYYINASIKYDVDLGYASNVDIVIVKNNNKLEIAKMETK